MCWLQCVFFFCFKQKTAYEMRISDWSSDVCSSDLIIAHGATRDAAIDRLVGALGEFEVAGVKTNIPALIDLLRPAPFRAGKVHTGLDRNRVVSGKGVSIRVVRGGRRQIKNKKDRITSMTRYQLKLI